MKRKGLRGYFITGLLIVVPLYITAYVFMLIVGFMNSVTKILPVVIRPETYLGTAIPGIGIAVTIVMVFVIGVLATNLLGRKLVHIGEAIVGRIPVIRNVYRGTKQFMETFFVKGHEGFSRVVMIEYPRKGIYSIAFVTGKTRGEVRSRTSDSMINLFLPTTPNPTSGYYLVVPIEDTLPLSMSVEDAFKVIMSGGMVVPSDKEVIEAGGKPEAGSAQAGAKQ